MHQKHHLGQSRKTGNPSTKGKSGTSNPPPHDSGKPTRTTTLGTDPVLFGDQAIESATASAPSGVAQAFPFSDQLTGTATSITVYVDASNQASGLITGLYSDKHGRPGSLLATGSLPLPVAGAWNTVSVSSTSVSAGRNYWIALLGSGGTLYFRDRSSGPCTSAISSTKNSLSSLSASWPTGSQSSSCPASTFVSGFEAPPWNTVAPTIRGQDTQGRTLSASTGSWANSPSSYAYQWQNCTNSACSNIAGATSPNYTLQASDVGKTAHVIVTASDAGGSASATSAQTAMIVADPSSPPVNTALPTISGTTTQGQTLTASTGSWNNSPTSYAYQWQDCDTSGGNCSNISGATASSYTLASSDVGHIIRAVVTASNAGGSSSATSSQTAIVAPPAPVNTALPQVSGTTTQGQTLSTTNGSWSNSPTSYAYQWEDCDTSGANCTNINGATANTYTLTSNDVGHTLRAAVTATNSGGSASANSAQSAVVAASPPPVPSNSAPPQINGSPVQGQTLSTSNGTWNNSPSSYTYQWQDCDSSGANCTNINGATANTYTLTSNDVGHTLRAAVTATNSGGSGAATSSQSAVIAADPPPAPSNTALPQVTGTTTQGQTLSTSNGTWSNSPTSYTYQWQDCDSTGANCTNISGVTSSGYTLTSSDVGHTIRALVTASNAGGSTPATSAQTATVAAPAPSNTALPAITGTTTQGQTLSTSNGTWSNSPTSYTYQWQDCTTTGCQNIAGATSSSYTLQASDVGSAIDVVVTATNSVGSGSATSAHTATVSAPAPSNTALPQVTGTTTQGQTLSTSNGSWNGSPASYTYQWQDCDTSGANCTNISGAVSNTYTLAAGDVGDTVRSVVTASNTGGSASDASAQTGVVTTGGTSYAPTYVQSNATLNSTGSGLRSGTCAFNSSVTSGDLIVVAVGYRGAVQTLTPTDTLGTTFHLAGTPTNTTQSTGPYTGAIYWGVAPAGGADTVTINFPSSTGYVEVYDQEYNAANAQLDATSNATGTGTTVTSGAATTHHNNELIFGYMVVNNTIGSPGTGFTERGNVGGDMTEDRDVSTPGSYAATASNPPGDGWQGQMATFYGTGPNNAPTNSVPTVTQVNPNSGSTSGGTSVTITGTSFTGATAVTLGSTKATNFTVNSATQITATSPAEAAGTVGTTVTTPNGTSATNPSDEFTFSSGGGGTPVNSVGPYFTASTLGGANPTTCSNGCAVVGQTLAVNTGTWSPAPTSYTYQWERCTTTSAQPPTTGSCTAISGATSSSYTVQSADTGHSLVPVVTAYNGGTASTATGLSNGSCDTGEELGEKPNTYPSAVPNAQPAGCSPISAVVGTSQTAERFCTNAVTTCGYADPMNQTAGVPAKVTPSTTGACASYTNGGTISSGTVVINGCKITGSLSITGGNVTIENSDLGGFSSPQGQAVNISGGTVSASYDTIHGASAASEQGIQIAMYVHGSGTLTEDHVFSYNSDRIAHNTSSANTGLTVTNSFCWSNANFDSESEHSECTYTGPPANTVVKNSVFENWRSQTADVYVDDNTGSNSSTNLDTEYNLLVGGAYETYGGYRSSGSCSPGSCPLVTSTADTFIGNRYSRAEYATGGSSGASAFTSPSETQSGNIWDDTGSTVNP